MLKRYYFFIKSFLSSLLFPRICVGCGKDIRWICDECLKTIDIIREPFCPECRRPTLAGEFCENCRSRFALDGIFICANFGEGVLKEAIHQFKYNSIADIGGVLGKIMIGKMKNYESSLGSTRDKRIMNQEWEFDLVVPVPLHKKRLRERGFNQSEILARAICRDGHFVLAKNILIRKKYTTPQMELDREQRLENLKDVFEFVGDNDFLKNKNILLVDDVTTTGATLEECAKILKQNGAEKVWAIVLAKGK